MKKDSDLCVHDIHVNIYTTTTTIHTPINQSTCANKYAVRVYSTPKLAHKHTHRYSTQYNANVLIYIYIPICILCERAQV